jgi:hypothetical protein
VFARNGDAIIDTSASNYHPILKSSRPLYHFLIPRVDEVLAVVTFGGEAIPTVEVGSVRHLTIIFNAFVFCQIFNEFNGQSVRCWSRIPRPALSCSGVCR